MAKVTNKTKTVYVCSECGNDTPKWQGQCPACGAWNSLFEQIVEPEKAVTLAAAKDPLKRSQPRRRLRSATGHMNA